MKLGIFKSFQQVIATLKFIVTHPLNKGRSFEAIRDWLFWQVGSRLVPGPVTVSFVDNSKLLIRPGMTGATGNIYTGLCEFEPMSFLLHFLRPNDLFIDVGANVGSYSILAAMRGARCLAFEPVLSACKILSESALLNDFGNIIKICNLALGNEKKRVEFTSFLDTTNHVICDAEKQTGAIEIEMDTLDNVVRGLGPSLIKIDVEGYEGNVIKGAHQVMSEDSLLALIIELNGLGSRYGFSDDFLHQQILGYGFKPYKYLPFSRQMIPLDSKDSSSTSIYVRHHDAVMDRITSAPSFRVKNKTL